MRLASDYGHFWGYRFVNAHMYACMDTRYRCIHYAYACINLWWYKNMVDISVCHINLLFFTVCWSHGFEGSWRMDTKLRLCCGRYFFINCNFQISFSVDMLALCIDMQLIIMHARFLIFINIIFLVLLFCWNLTQMWRDNVRTKLPHMGINCC